tara:strand:+ start:6754 stop:7176 length:423 start_codon:yes stop_codon:yes gene_type:complete
MIREEFNRKFKEFENAKIYDEDLEGSGLGNVLYFLMVGKMVTYIGITGDLYHRMYGSTDSHCNNKIYGHVKYIEFGSRRELEEEERIFINMFPFLTNKQHNYRRHIKYISKEYIDSTTKPRESIKKYHSDRAVRMSTYFR